MNVFNVHLNNISQFITCLVAVLAVPFRGSERPISDGVWNNYGVPTRGGHAVYDHCVWSNDRPVHQRRADPGLARPAAP